MTTTPRGIPLNFFGIPFGILGLADCWLVVASFGLAPVAIGRGLIVVAMIVWGVVLGSYAKGVRRRGISLAAELGNAVAGPFASLAVIAPMLAAADALYPLSHPAGIALVDVLVVATVLLAGWFTGQWIYRPVPLASLHPGYFLPTVAGGLVAAASAALVGQLWLAEMLFGLGLICWIVLGSIILGRLGLGPPLPVALTPTLAIEVAPPAVATFAIFAINGNRIDTVVQVLAGYGLRRGELLALPRPLGATTAAVAFG
jgi:tellurite resistance protein